MDGRITGGNGCMAFCEVCRNSEALLVEGYLCCNSILMINEVSISNFKSVQELTIELGRVNVFIGENGCGKTSILEGVAIGSAAYDEKLDNEFLSSRGIRLTDSNMMKSGFSKESQSEPISIGFINQSKQRLVFKMDTNDKIRNSLTNKDVIFDLDVFRKNLDEHLMRNKLFHEKVGRRAAENLREEVGPDEDINKPEIKERLDLLVNQALKDFLRSDEMKEILQREGKEYINEYLANFNIGNFLVYAPENFFLRRFEEEGQIRPLGIRGEGLFRHLTELSKDEPETLAKVTTLLSLIDWFDGLSIPENLSFSERRIGITDRFIQDTIQQFDQRSANEGFLFLLFYFTLFTSKYTPKFFAIDNIDTALNPRLCAKLIQEIVKISAENEKQCILTTHNPAVLDGLDLNDDAQRLFVIYRNADGETSARRVMPPKVVEGAEKVRLSEAFMRGYLGGLPQNF